ncbi:MAG TPA: hypothetical protein VEB59_03985 [Gemmatimonadales bacterium]|nr:hypothetical protein [Gemmatimonadales bacterium]
MRAPASSLRSLATLRAGVVSRAPARPSAGTQESRISARLIRTLVPLLLLAALAACDGAVPTAPDVSGGDAPGARGRERAPAAPAR